MSKTDGPISVAELAAMSPDGLHILTELMFIKSGQTVVYHVGNLDNDRARDPEGYRTGEVDGNEIDCIAWIAEAASEKGQCQLHVTKVTDAISAYYAVGL